MTKISEEEKAAARKEYFEVADKINALLAEVKFAYPDLPEQLDSLIGKYAELHHLILIQ